MIFFVPNEFSPRYGNKFYTINIDSYEMKNEISHGVCSCLPSQFIIYKIKIFSGNRAWVVERRYTDFLNLYNAHNSRSPRVNISFPPKTLFNVSHDLMFLQKRQELLNSFLVEYLQLESQTGSALENDLICNFLELVPGSDENEFPVVKDDDEYQGSRIMRFLGLRSSIIPRK
jgi:hypothetical protein